MNSEDRKRIRKQKHRIMMMRLWLPVVLVVVLVAGLTAGGIAMSLGQTKSVAEQGTKETETKENETKGTSNEPKETGDVNGEAQTGEIDDSTKVNWGDGVIATGDKNIHNNKYASVTQNDSVKNKIAEIDSQYTEHTYPEKNKDYKVTITGKCTEIYNGDKINDR